MRTYDQKTSTQRKLAITRALDELSLQRGVKVEMSLEKQESYKNGNGSTQMNVGANYQTKGTITAHIEEVYEDKVSGELFIWMVLD
jgi:undecaprenyl pyrophosphate synthase